MVTTAQAALDAAVRAVASATLRARELPPDERTRLVAGIDAAVARLTTARATVLVAQRDSGAWRASGDPTFEAWRARTSRTGARAAVTEVRRGDALATMPAVRDAVDEGRVTVEHVDVVARTAAGASAPVQEALASPEGQAELLAMAARVDAGRFAKAAALWAAALDRSALERGHQAQRARRFLHLAETPDGTRISGQLDAVAGTRVVVDAEGQPMDLGRTTRLHTAGQRRAVTVRDGGCFWPGCGTPTRWCEVHHLAWWDRDGGETSVDDGALACSFHHHELHRLDLTVTRYTVPAGSCGPGESPTRYMVETPGGRVLADGRPEDDTGNRAGEAVRAWVPGRGAVDPTGDHPRSAHAPRAIGVPVAC